jgi:GWxTD domain-containing protein
MFLKSWFPLLLFLPLWARPGAAQDSAQRAELERFRDSLKTATDTGALAALEHRMIDIARVDRDNALLHLKLGFLALRVADLGSRSRYNDAGSEFEWAGEIEPDWPYPWFGLGNAEAGTADSNYGFRTRFQAVFHADPLTRAANALKHSTTVDSTFVPGLIGLVSVVSRQALNSDPEAALEILRRAAHTEAGKSLDFLLARASLERDLGYADSAAVAYREYLSRGGNQNVGRFELTRTLLATGDLSAQGLYYEVAGLDDSVVIKGLRDDISIIAGDSGLAQFDSAGTSGRAAFLARFWTRRDRADLRKDGERLAENYRRIFYARLHFRRVPSKRRIRGFEAYRPAQRAFDARGEIYIRHGEPTERVEFPDFCNVSWRYARADGDLTFHFLGAPAENDYNLVGSVLSVCDAGSLWLSRVFSWGPQYRKMVAAGPNSTLRFNREQEWAALDDIREGVTTDRDALTFPRTLPAAAQVVAVGRGDGGAILHVVYAVPGDSLRADTTMGVVSYLLRSRISVLSPTGDPIANTDVTRRYRVNGPIPKGQLLTGRETLIVPPGFMNYHIALEQGDSLGGVLPTGAIRVGRFGYDRDSLTLSGLVLGSRTMGLTWNPTPEDTVFFNPLGTFREGGSLELYYEVYGLPASTTYATELSVFKRGGRRPEITLGFTETAEEDVTRSHRTIQLDRLHRGDYDLQVEITDPTGRKVTERSAFRVVKDPSLH